MSHEAHIIWDWFKEHNSYFFLLDLLAGFKP